MNDDMRQTALAAAAVIDDAQADIAERTTTPMPSLHSRYNEHSDRYMAMVARGNAAHHAVTRRLLAYLGLDDDANPQIGRTAIDFCCGHGAFTRLLAQRLRGFVAALDVAQALLEHARQVEAAQPLGITYHHGSIHDPTLMLGSYDLAACCLALTDVDDLDAAMRTTARHLTPGGIFAFAINHPCAPREDGQGGIWWPEHAYTEQRLTRSPNKDSVRYWISTWDRPLSLYLNAALNAGLELLATEDIAPPDYVIQRTPAMAQHPYMFVASWRKPNLAESATHTASTELRRTLP